MKTIIRELFANSLKLTRFFLHRERVTSTVWIVLLVGFSMALAPGLDQMFPDDEARENILTMYDNPIMVSMMGPIYGHTTGAVYSSMMLLWYLIAVAVMNIFLATRHTRADEEQFRTEVVRSLPVGRLAGVNATMLTALIINSALAIFTGLGLAVTQTPTMDFAGCMLYGAVSGAVGLVFAAVTLVFCQLSQSTSGAVGMSFAALGGFYMLRAAGDISSEALSLISPLGLPLRTKAFTDNNWLPVFALLCIAIVVAVLAYKLNSMRDLGQGFIAAKPGRETASRSLLSTFGLSIRLLRKQLIIWVVVMLMAGASYGSVIGDIGSYVSNMPQYLEIVGLPPEVIETLSDEQMDEISAEYAVMITEYFGVFIAGMMTLVGLIPALIFGMRLRSEEKDGRVEHVISRAVSRTRYLFGFVVIAVISTVLMQLSTSIGLYYVSATVSETLPFELNELVSAYLLYLPAMWVMVGAAVFMVGFFPKSTGIVWGYYGFTCFVMFMGGMDVLPEPITALSPMSHVPAYPKETLETTPLLILSCIAVSLTVAGFIGYRKRDMM
jgi:ABC-2 type transport system permease protein